MSSISLREKKINWNLLKVIFCLAGPTMLEQFLQTAVQYVDTAMVSSLGTRATAAVGATATVNWLVGTTISAFGVGFLGFISQAIGAGNVEKAKKAAGQAVFIAVSVGLLFTAIVLGVARFVPAWMQVDPQVQGLAATYFFIIYSPLLFRTFTIIFGTVLRAAGDTKSPMKAGLAVNAVNVVLNYLLIFDTKTFSLFGHEFTLYRAGMGVIGAGVASAVSVAAGGILICMALFRNKEISPRGVSFKPDKEILAPCLKVAFPNMLQRFWTSLGYVVFASMINALGEASTAALLRDKPEEPSSDFCGKRESARRQ